MVFIHLSGACHGSWWCAKYWSSKEDTSNIPTIPGVPGTTLSLENQSLGPRPFKKKQRFGGDDLGLFPEHRQKVLSCVVVVSLVSTWWLRSCEVFWGVLDIMSSIANQITNDLGVRCKINLGHPWTTCAPQRRMAWNFLNICWTEISTDLTRNIFCEGDLLSTWRGSVPLRFNHLGLKMEFLRGTRWCRFWIVGCTLQQMTYDSSKVLENQEEQRTWELSM